MQGYLRRHPGKFLPMLFAEFMAGTGALDRFSREGVTETLNHPQKLTAAGVQFKSFTEQYLDSTSLFRDAIIAILAAIAKQERVRQDERTKAALVRKQEAGVLLGRPGVDVLTRIKQLRAGPIGAGYFHSAGRKQVHRGQVLLTIVSFRPAG